MRVHLIFGFLGSGKTTLLRGLLERGGTTVPTGIIVNEFGEVGIDGAILQGDAIDVVELNSGCLCCTLKGSLTDALRELQQKRGVERVIVEATGVAQPAELIRPLAELMAQGELDFGPIVTVLDAANYDRLDAMLGEFLDLQVKSADILLLNKIDLVDAALIETIHGKIRALNPSASLLYTEQCDVDSALLLDGGTSAILAAVSHDGSHDRHDRGYDHDHDHTGHGHADPHVHGALDSFAIDGGADMSRDSVEAFFGSLPGDVWRAKGFVRIDGQAMLVQYVLGRLELAPAPAGLHQAMVFIGHDLDRERIAKDFHRTTELQYGAV